MTYRENQQTVSDWSRETFGPAASNARVAARVNEEMAELLRALTTDDNHPHAAEEAADVVIVLYGLARRMGFDLHAEIDRKMITNRDRIWAVDGWSGEGIGYHVKAGEVAP